MNFNMLVIWFNSLGTDIKIFISIITVAALCSFKNK